MKQSHGPRMRIAIISDIHSNLPALESVLRRIQELNADAIYCLGDIVGYGPFPNECVTLIRNHCSLVVKGNHDSGVLDETPIEHFNAYGQAGVRWSRKQITPENLEFLRSLPLIATAETMTLVHSSPSNPANWTYVLTLDEAKVAFSAFTTAYCFIGHTHLPVLIAEDLSLNMHRKGIRYLVNVGSVGQPRDGNPAAAFGFFDSDLPDYTLQRVPYDAKPVIKAIRSAGLPAFLGKRLIRGI